MACDWFIYIAKCPLVLQKILCSVKVIVMSFAYALLEPPLEVKYLSSIAHFHCFVKSIHGLSIPLRWNTLGSARSSFGKFLGSVALFSLFPGLAGSRSNLDGSRSGLAGSRCRQGSASLLVADLMFPRRTPPPC